MEPRPHAPRPHRRLATAMGVVLLAAVSTGCGVRLASPPVAEPVPDALELVRRTAVSDAVGVAESADAALAAVPAKRTKLVAELTRIAADSRSQAAELGGEYDSGLATGEPSGTAPTPSEGTVGGVVQSLVDAAARSKTAAVSTGDGGLARLLASVGAAQTVSGTRLAALADVAGPDAVDPVIPAPAADDDDSDANDADDDATVEPTVSDTPSGSSSPSASPDPDDTVPEGLTAGQLSALVESEDSTGYALRLRAARTDGTARERLVALHDTHTARAEGWVDVAGTRDGPQDPRRAAYTVPRADDEGDEALVRTLENDLATDYASLVGTTAAGTRGVLVDLVVDVALTLDDWGATPVPFPGLPEQSE